MKYLILIESRYSSLPFDGFAPKHKGLHVNVWESYKTYYKNDAINYMDRLMTKHPDSIENITIEEVND